MGKPFNGCETLNRAPRWFAINANAPSEQKENRQKDDHADQCPTAPLCQRAFSELVPGHAAVLHEHFADVATGRDRYIGLSVAQLPPQLRIRRPAKNTKLRTNRRRVRILTQSILAKFDRFAPLPRQNVFKCLCAAGGASVRFNRTSFTSFLSISADCQNAEHDRCN